MSLYTHGLLCLRLKDQRQEPLAHGRHLYHRLGIQHRLRCQAILTLAGEENATFMVMGAYGHSRIRQFLLGGVTRHILGRASIPILMAH